MNNSDKYQGYFSSLSKWKNLESIFKRFEVFKSQKQSKLNEAEKHMGIIKENQLNLNEKMNKTFEIVEYLTPINKDFKKIELNYELVEKEKKKKNELYLTEQENYKIHMEKEVEYKRDTNLVNNELFQKKMS
jgi:hypothetical protein